MKPTGVFVTPEELEHVRTARKCSGMWLSDGTPLGDPGHEVHILVGKYHPPEGSGLSLEDGQFYLP